MRMVCTLRWWPDSLAVGCPARQLGRLELPTRAEMAFASRPSYRGEMRIYELIDNRTGRSEPFETIRLAIDHAERRKLGTYEVVELRSDGSRIVRLSVST